MKKKNIQNKKGSKIMSDKRIVNIQLTKTKSVVAVEIGKNEYVDADGVTYKNIDTDFISDVDDVVDIIDAGKSFCSDDGLVYTADFKYLVFCPLGRRGTVKIHEGTERVYEYACYECNFNHLIIPSSVKRIEKYAFNRNRLLEYVDGGEELESIGDMSFMNCTSLKKFSFGPNLKRIGEYVFMNTQLTKILLPEGLKYVGSQAFDTANLKDNGEISHITPDKMYDIHLPVSLKEIGRAAFCNAANIYTKEANLSTVRAGIRSSGASLGHGCDFWKLHIDGLQPIVMPKEIDSINVIARRVRLYTKGETTSPPETYSESRLATKYATALEHRKLYPGKDVDEFLSENIEKVFVLTIAEKDGEKLMAEMSETKQFSKRIQDILDGLELRAGKRKVRTKEDLKKCFRTDCVNIYSAEENGKPRLYRRTDLTTWAAEAFSRGENYFCAEPVDPKKPYGKLKLAKPRYVYTCSRALTEEEFKAVFGEEKK